MDRVADAHLLVALWNDQENLALVGADQNWGIIFRVLGVDRHLDFAFVNLDYVLNVVHLPILANNCLRNFRFIADTENNRKIIFPSYSFLQMEEGYSQ